MASHIQNVLALLVVALAVAHLVWRARRFYLSFKTRSGTPCGGCTACARSTRGIFTRPLPRDRHGGIPHRVTDE